MKAEGASVGRTGWIVSYLARLVAAVILVQTLFFKFTAAPESVEIFTKVGMEPVGRIGSGIAELFAAILLLIPGTGWLGAALGLAVMVGAIGAHLTVLGIEVAGDGGTLFGLAVAVAVCCVVVLGIHRKSIPAIGRFLP